MSRTFRVIVHPIVLTAAAKSLDILTWQDHPGCYILPYLCVEGAIGSLETRLYQFLDDMHLWLPTNEVHQLSTWMDLDVIHVCYLVTVRPDAFQSALEANSTLHRWDLNMLTPQMVTGSSEPSPDEKQVVAAVSEQLQRDIYGWRQWLGFMPEQFTLLQLQTACELISNLRLNKDAFRRKVVASGRLEPAEGKEKGLGRPATLYRITY